MKEFLQIEVKEVGPNISKLSSEHELLLYGTKQVTKIVIRYRNAVMTIVQLLKAVKSSKEFTIFLIENLNILLEEAGKCACKEVTKGTAKQVTIKAAVSTGWECAKGVSKGALLCGAAIDGGMLAIQVGYSIYQYSNNKINGHTFRCDTVRNASTAVGSFTGGAAGTMTGTLIGAAVGSFFPGIGTALGAFIGGAIGGVVVGTAGSYAGKAVGNKINKKLDQRENRKKVVKTVDKKL